MDRALVVLPFAKIFAVHWTDWHRAALVLAGYTMSNLIWGCKVYFRVFYFNVLQSTGNAPAQPLSCPLEDKAKRSHGAKSNNHNTALPSNLQNKALSQTASSVCIRASRNLSSIRWVIMSKFWVGINEYKNAGVDLCLSHCFPVFSDIPNTTVSTAFSEVFISESLTLKTMRFATSDPWRHGVLFTQTVLTAVSLTVIFLLVALK